MESLLEARRPQGRQLSRCTAAAGVCLVVALGNTTGAGGEADGGVGGGRGEEQVVVSLLVG